MSGSVSTLKVVETATLTASFKRAVARWIEKRQGYKPGDVTEVIGWDESVDSGGGCSTCGWGASIDVEIDYRLADSRTVKTLYYDGSFSSILTEILSMDDD